MKRISCSSVVLALTSSLLFGCAGAQRGSVKKATSASPTEAVVSPSAYRTDPVGYVAAILGVPNFEDPKGRFNWKTDKKSRYEEVRHAIAAWCVDNGGKLPLRRPDLNETCSNAQGQVLTRFNVFYNPDSLDVTVETPAMARQYEGEYREQVDSHKRYVASNGASGSIKLVDGRRFEVLRFGTTAAPIDYDLNAVKGQQFRMLREVRSMRRVTKDGKNKLGTFDVHFVDGSSGKASYGLGNGYLMLTHANVLSGRSVTFGGIHSSHLLLVVRSDKKSSPTQVRIVYGEIEELQIDKIDEGPVAPIAVRNRDDKLASALRRRWDRAAAGVSVTPYYSRSMHDGPSWCSQVTHGTIESFLVCQQLWAEHEFAIQAGKLTPQTTPAMLSGEHITTLAHRSLM